MTMEVVIDTSAIIAVLLGEPERDRLITVTDQVELVAPQSLHWEIGNALVAMMRRQRITLDQAQKAITLYQQIRIRLVDVDLAQSAELGQRHNLYAYDAYMMVCALRRGSPLLSLDARLRAAARDAGITVWEVSS